MSKKTLIKSFIIRANWQVYRNPQMKNTTNLLILNLAVADLLFLLVCVPATASDYILMYWPFGLTWCRLELWTFLPEVMTLFLSQDSSIHNLCHCLRVNLHTSSDGWRQVLSIYKRPHDVIPSVTVSHKMLVTKHNERSETLEEMGAERPEILVL